MREYIIEILLLVILLILGFTIFNPYAMPMGMHLIALVALVVVFIAFAALLWKESGGDEREIAIRHKIDRVAFLAGATVLLVALVAESLTTHVVNIWVLLSLGVMVVAKIAASIYYNR